LKRRKLRAEDAGSLFRLSTILALLVCAGGLLFVYINAYPQGRVLVDINQYNEALLETMFITCSVAAGLVLAARELHSMLKEINGRRR